MHLALHFASPGSLQEVRLCLTSEFEPFTPPRIFTLGGFAIAIEAFVGYLRN